MLYLEAFLIFLFIGLIWILCKFAHKKRHEFPRSVLFFYCFLPFALGLGLLTFTCMDFIHDQVNPIFFKTPSAHAVSKFDSPKLFIIGLIFNVLFSLAFVSGGLFGMFKAITNTDFRFNE